METEIKYICKDCGIEPNPDEDKSNENWKYFKNEPCKHCGGKLKVIVK